MKKCEINYNHTITVENLFVAWREFLRGKQKRPDVMDFQMRLADNLFGLHRDLNDKTYTHGAYYEFQISDPKPRLIHKASVRDRIVHRLVYTALYPYFDNRFIYDSYSSRREKGTHRALARFRTFSGRASKNHAKTIWILKCDIRKFFANIDHQILKNIMQKRTESPDVLWLIDAIIDSFHTEGKQGIGLPLGNLTSQLLVNIYMNEFDQFTKHELKAPYYTRYADDFAFMSTDRHSLVSFVPKIREFLIANLHLELHPDKISIETAASGIDFLGWVHFPNHRVLRTTTKRRMLKNLSGNPKLSVIASYQGMLSYGNTHKLCKMLLKT